MPGYSKYRRPKVPTTEQRQEAARRAVRTKKARQVDVDLKLNGVVIPGAYHPVISTQGFLAPDGKGVETSTIYFRNKNALKKLGDLVMTQAYRYTDDYFGDSEANFNKGAETSLGSLLGQVMGTGRVYLRFHKADDRYDNMKDGWYLELGIHQNDHWTSKEPLKVEVKKQAPAPVDFGSVAASLRAAAEALMAGKATKVKRWMMNNAKDHVDRKTGELNMTSLGEAALAEFDGLDEDTAFELAFEVSEKEKMDGKMTASVVSAASIKDQKIGNAGSLKDGIWVNQSVSLKVELSKILRDLGQKHLADKTQDPFMEVHDAPDEPEEWVRGKYEDVSAVLTNSAKNAWRSAMESAQEAYWVQKVTEGVLDLLDINGDDINYTGDNSEGEPVKVKSKLEVLAKDTGDVASIYSDPFISIGIENPAHLENAYGRAENPVDQPMDKDLITEAYEALIAHIIDNYSREILNLSDIDVSNADFDQDVYADAFVNNAMDEDPETIAQEIEAYASDKGLPVEDVVDMVFDAIPGLMKKAGAISNAMEGFNDPRQKKLPLSGAVQTATYRVSLSNGAFYQILLVGAKDEREAIKLAESIKGANDRKTLADEARAAHIIGEEPPGKYKVYRIEEEPEESLSRGDIILVHSGGEG